MDKPQPISAHYRLQELLAIPERQRTEAQWDEINELEITLTPVNRAITSERSVRHKATVSDQFKPRDGTQNKRPPKKLRKRPPKGGPP